MPRVHLNIGSNLGDRADNISRAVARVRQLAISLNGGRDGDFRVSAIIESEPWGFVSSNKFINVGVSFITSADAMDLLRDVKRIEQELGSGGHRNSDGSYRDRVVDIDIIMYGREQINEAILTVPHPRAAGREFVMRPLREIDPELYEYFMHKILTKNTEKHIKV